jgi:hypothetical protein
MTQHLRTNRLRQAICKALRIIRRGHRPVCFAVNGWRGMDSWEAVFEGRPMSFQMLEEKWPGLVSVDEYLASFKHSED